jgi:hypothetical protein
MKFKRISVGALVVASLFFGNVAMASDSTTSPTPGPKDLTWSQLSNLQKTSSPTSTMPGISSLRVSAPSCTIDTGYIYFRASGNVYDNGAIGLKPLLRCTTVMPFVSLSTTIYKKVWWGLQYQTGPVTTTGSNVSQIQTKNIEQPCMSRKATTVFYAIVTSSSIFPNGATGNGSAYQENSLDCATF